MQQKIIMQEKIDDLVAFLCGDLLATVFALFHFNFFSIPLESYPYWEILYKLSMAAGVGIVGGFFGLFGKDIYIKYLRTSFLRKKTEKEETKEDIK